MTTGRINQVTIVRRVKANRPCFRAEEFTKLLGRRAQGPRGRAARPALRRSRRGSHPLSPPEFPRAPSAGENGQQTRAEDTA